MESLSEIMEGLIESAVRFLFDFWQSEERGETVYILLGIMAVAVVVLVVYSIYFTISMKKKDKENEEIHQAKRNTDL
jgi:uncharacterized membrane protein